jgi:hypothetical protein
MLSTIIYIKIILSEVFPLEKHKKSPDVDIWAFRSIDLFDGYFNYERI